MEDSVVTEKVYKVLADQLKVSEKAIVPEAFLAGDLGADSLDAIEITMALEDEFNIDIPDEDADNFQTVADLIKFIKAKV